MIRSTRGTKYHQQPPSDLYPIELDLPISAMLLSALLDLRPTHQVPADSGRVLNDSDRVSSGLLKMQIGAPIRCCPRLPYQISSRIDSGVKYFFSNVDSLLDPKTHN
jgi:hypothetical protein